MVDTQSRPPLVPLLAVSCAPPSPVEAETVTPPMARLSERFFNHPVLGAVSMSLLFATLFMLVRPYQGIRHDAILYTVQALHNAHPENFRHDLFFAFGSQDQWTLYGKLYEKLIALIGIRAGNLTGLVLAHLLWWTGVGQVARRVLPAPWHWIAVLFVVAMPSDYGNNFAFFYAEPWLTARLPAEGLCLWALAFAIDRKHWIAIALTLAAMTLHPLNGAVGFAAVVMVATSRLPWWRIFAVLLLLFSALQYGTPSWFAIHPLDSIWRGVLRTEIDYLFPSLWSLFAWSKACWVIALPLILHADEAQAQRRLWGGLALIGISGMVCATLADIGGHDALWIALQFWRVLWLLTVMQWLALPALLLQYWCARPALIWWLALCWMTLEVGGGVAALVIAALCNARPLLRTHATASQLLACLDVIDARYKGWLIALTLPAFATWAIAQMAFGMSQADAHEPLLAMAFPLLDIIIHSRFMAVTVGAMCACCLLGDKKALVAFYVALFGLLVYGAANFDQRATTIKIMEARLDDPARAPFAGKVAPGSLVYWDGPWHELVYPWLLMRTASYFSPAQASGMVFQRDTTFEALRRASVIGGPDGDAQAAKEIMRRAGTIALPANTHTIPGENTLLFRRMALYTPLDPEGIRRVCADVGVGHDAVNFVVSPENDTTLGTDAQWEASPTKRYWLYDCKRIRSTLTSPLAADARGMSRNKRQLRGGENAIG